MKTISDALLKSLAGSGAYQRGKDYFESGVVGDLKRSGNKIIAEVEGSEVYQVTLVHTQNAFEGTCDCPASDNFDFCKHCVATAMQYRKESQEVEEGKAGDKEERLSAYLGTLSKDQLVKELVKLIQDDSVTLDAWSLRADAALGVLDYKSIRKRITAAIPYNRNLYRYAQVRNYFARVEALVDQLMGLTSGFPADKALELVEYALERINKALDTIDDSGGFRYYAVDQLCQAHVDTCKRLDWQPDKFANHLFRIYEGESYDIYPAIPEAYFEVLGDGGIEAFNQTLEAEWESLPDLTADADWDTRYPYIRLENALVAIAESRGDIDRIIEIKKKTANEWHDFLNLSKLCLEHDRIEQATQWLERARRCNHRYGSDRLDEHQVKIFLAQEEFDQALAMQWQIYQQRPGLGDYKRLLTIADQHCKNSKHKKEKREQVRGEWFAKAADFLEQQIQLTSGKFQQQRFIDCLAQLWLYENQFENALQLAEKYPVGVELLLEIASANKQLPERALPLYIRYAANEVNRKDKHGYREAVKTLKRAEKHIGKDCGEKLYQEIRDLGIKHKAKRNFMKFLKEDFPDLNW